MADKESVAKSFEQEIVPFSLLQFCDSDFNQNMIRKKH